MKTILKKDSDDDGISFWPLEISALGGVTTTNPALSPWNLKDVIKPGMVLIGCWWCLGAFVDLENFIDIDDEIDADVDDDDEGGDLE